MLLFKPEHVEKILSGEKTQTRRLWKKPRVKVGAVHGCYTKPPWMKEKPFARVRIVALRQEPLCAITDEDAKREGYSSRAIFLDVFREINYKQARLKVFDQLARVWVVDFKLVA